MLLYTDSRKKFDHSSYGLLFTLNAFDLSWLTDCNLLTSSSDILRILRLKNEIKVVSPNQTHLPDQVQSLFSS